MFREEPKAKAGSLCSRLPPKRWGAKGARRSKFILLLKSWKKKFFIHLDIFYFLESDLRVSTYNGHNVAVGWCVLFSLPSTLSQRRGRVLLPLPCTGDGLL